jgi:hypothetical protein
MDMHTASSAALLVGDGKDRRRQTIQNAKGILESFIPGNNLRSSGSCERDRSSRHIVYPGEGLLERLSGTQAEVIPQAW